MTQELTRRPARSWGHRPVRVCSVAGLVLLLLAGCSDGGSSTGASSTAASSAGASSAGASSGSAAPASAADGSSTSAGATSAPRTSPSGRPAAGTGAGCPATTGGTPAGAVTRPTVDVDGDGRPDTEWIAADGMSFGVTTASRATFSARIELAGGAERSALVADVTGRGEFVAFASDGRTAGLWAISRCSLVTELNGQGTQYQFDLGFRGTGTGVGCVDATGDGTRDLVGLNVATDSGGKATSIARTVIELRGPQARNGATSTVRDPSPQAVELARSITCGDLTLTADGVTTGG